MKNSINISNKKVITTMATMTAIITLIIIGIQSNMVYGDVYLHNPRGSNNRCDERSNNRNNANRLFDSQNNAAGGYAIGCNRPEDAVNDADITCYQMEYYTDTIIPIRWTSQHNCGENNDCQFILQYSCEGQLGNDIRDGHPQNPNGDTCTERIPEKTDSQLEENERISPYKYGKHEDYTFYQRCKERERNPHLFTADQKLKGKSAIYTRQNPNGDRYGFECPEERDYYPYWSESDWRDIAVLTTDTSKCDYYRQNSQCVTEKHECVGGTRFSTTEEECNLHGGLWYTYPQFPESQCNFTCTDAPTSTINRLGLGVNSTTHTTFHWKLPSAPLQNCVLRLRYNISTKETPWEFTSANNSQLKNNPVKNTTQGIPVRMAINTAQYGRTFEDRTYTFNIVERPQELKEKMIHNVNVQGKRGNIAQVRNCIEYDFVPNILYISEEEYIHFQWLGSDYNPAGNDGEGRAGTDRSNVVVIDTKKDNMPSDDSTEILTEETLKILASLGQPIEDSEKCYTFEQLVSGNKRNDQQSLKNCALLNRAEPYFNFPPIKPSSSGKVKAMSSRNNNFSNRGQKLVIIVYKSGEDEIVDGVNFQQEAKSSTDNSDNNTIMVGSIIGGILGAIALVMIVYGTVIYIRKRGGISKIKRDFKRNLSSHV